jgi:hypothetical protein
LPLRRFRIVCMALVEQICTADCNKAAVNALKQPVLVAQCLSDHVSGACAAWKGRCCIVMLWSAGLLISCWQESRASTQKQQNTNLSALDALMQEVDHCQCELLLVLHSPRAQLLMSDSLQERQHRRQAVKQHMQATQNNRHIVCAHYYNRRALRTAS